MVVVKIMFKKHVDLFHIREMCVRQIDSTIFNTIYEQNNILNAVKP